MRTLSRATKGCSYAQRSVERSHSPWLVLLNELLGSVSVDHSVCSSNQPPPLFLSVKAGVTMIVGSDESDDWWMADVINIDGGARNPKVPTLFQLLMLIQG